MTKGGDFDISLYMKQVRRYHILSREEEAEIGKAIQSGDEKAVEKLVNHNLRFVVKHARQYRIYYRGRTGINFEDIIQVGNIGLFVAAKKFDYTKGFKFLSYAVWWIKSYTQSFIFYNWSALRVGSTQTRRKLFFHQKDMNELKQMSGLVLEKAKKRLAAKLDVKVFDVDHMLDILSEREISWDNTLNSHGLGPYRDSGYDNLTIANFIPVAPDQENVTLDNEQRRLVKEAMMMLTPREKGILTQRFFAGYSLREIGEKLKISRETVRLIEVKALKKMKENLESIGISKAYI